jgi:glycosyltransferase involved in cell wall biosynthesis
MNLAVVIPWNNRPELAATLARNSPVFRDFGCAVTIVNCGGDAAGLGPIARSAGVCASLVHLEGARFNRSLAVNLGIAHCDAPYVFVLDADLIVPAATLEECVRALDARHVLTIRRMRETQGQAWLEPGGPEPFLVDVVKLNSACFVFRDGRTISAPTFSSYAGDGSRGGQGQLIAARDKLIEVGGYNSQLTGWGYEDVDILVRLQYLAGLQHRQLGEVIHLSHGDAVRDLRGGSRGQSDYRNFRIACANYSSRRFLGTLAEDLATWRDRIRVDPVPPH